MQMHGHTDLPPFGARAGAAVAAAPGGPNHSHALPPAHGTLPPAGSFGAAGGISSITTVRFIRTFVFRMSQREFAELLGTSQGRVSTWESEGRFPSQIVMDLVRMNGRARCAADGLQWFDSWFFEVPDAAPVARLMAAERRHGRT